MADTIEFEAGSEEEAVDRASEAMGVAAGSLDYTVVDEGSEGVFGLGSRPVKIRVRPPGGAHEDTEAGDASEESAPARRGPAPEKAAKAEEVARSILERMGVPASVTVRDEDENIVVVVDEKDAGTAVGEALGSSRPPAIPALQFLLNKVVNRFPEDRKHVTVEVPSVPKRSKSRERPAKDAKPAGDQRVPSVDELRAAVDPELDASLVEVGLEVAQRATALGKVLTIHPMLPGDRRAVHQTVMRIPGVQTLSEGEGLYRRMHIVPDALARNGGGGGGKRRRRRRGSRKGGRPSASA